MGLQKRHWINKLNKMDKFKQLLKEEIIPRVESMLVEEKRHFIWLNGQDGKVDRILLNTFIKNSQTSIDHLELRLNQYNHYIDNNNEN